MLKIKYPIKAKKRWNSDGDGVESAEGTTDFSCCESAI
jgi:hypothetical protein